MIGGARGIGFGLDFSLPNQANRTGKKAYIEQEVLDSLCGVWIADQNTNESPNRNIIKNKLKDRGGDFEILNAAYKGMSGYSGYPIVFGASETWNNKGTISPNWYQYEMTSNKIHIRQATNKEALLYSYVKKNGVLTSHNKVFPSFRLKIKGLNSSLHIQYFYLKANDTKTSFFHISSDGIYTLPKSEIATESLITNDVWVGFYIVVREGNVQDCDITIEVLPDYKGSFVTDGVDDMIVSKKNTPDILNNGNEVTVVSMMVNLQEEDVRANFLSSPTSWMESTLKSTSKDKYHILNYKSTDYTTKANHSRVVETILGDKTDVTLVGVADNSTKDFNKFGVVGYNAGGIYRVGKVAWYWTFIANKVLTEDQINQVIAYYNLDKYVEPIVYYDVKKQGITNENHADFGDKLIDYSSNGRDLQLYNFGWKLDSGIGKYEVDFTSLAKTGRVDTITHNSVSYSIGDRAYYIVYKGLSDKIDTPAFKIKIEGTSLDTAYFYINSKGIKTSVIFNKDGVYELPTSYNSLYTGTEIYVSGLASSGGSGVITIIPEYEGALVYDGVEDYGQYVGDLGLKDYTVVMDKEVILDSITSNGRIGKSGTENYAETPFLLESFTADKLPSNVYSYGNGTSIQNTYKNGLSYLSKYLYNGQNISVGNGTGIGNGLILGAEFTTSSYISVAIKNFMLFPYSLSEFLIERQLKKRKLGTLYPDMIEWRPQIKSNVPYNAIEIYKVNPGSTNELLNSNSVDKTGTYYPVGSTIWIFVKADLEGIDEVSSITVNGKPYIVSRPNPNGFYQITYTLDKSPQKINITIDRYVRFEDIKQPYPIVVEVYDADTNHKYTWGERIKVGSFIYIKETNILPEFYERSGRYIFFKTSLDDMAKIVKEGSIYFIRDNMIEFTTSKKYLLGSNNPTCILFPDRLRIPNSSLKILGYIPDISGNGNHGVLNNFGYTEESGVGANNVVCFDGVEDYVSIPTLKQGGKQMFMKAEFKKGNCMAYDQRKVDVTKTFALYNFDTDTAYNSSSSGKTYIDGVLNNNIKCNSLLNLVHNITLTNNEVTADNSQSPYIGCRIVTDINLFMPMDLHAFMLFPEINTDEEIMSLNERIGIEGNVDMSGQGGGGGDEIPVKKINFDEWAAPNASVVKTATSFRITQVTAWSNVISTIHDKNKGEGFYIEETKIRVSGVSKGYGLTYGHHANKLPESYTNFWLEENKEYVLPKCYVGQGRNTVFKTQNISGDCDITVEIIE